MKITDLIMEFSYIFVMYFFLLHYPPETIFVHVVSINYPSGGWHCDVTCNPGTLDFL